MSKFNNRRAVPPEVLVMHADDTRTAAEALEQAADAPVSSDGYSVGRWSEQQIRRSHRPCSQCGDPGHAGALCWLSVPDAVSQRLLDYVDGPTLLREASDRIEAAQRAGDAVTVPDAERPVTADNSTALGIIREAVERLPYALHRLCSPSAGSADDQRRVSEAEARDGVRPGSTVHLHPVSPAQMLAQQAGISPAQAVADLEAATAGVWCFHPFAVCRGWNRPDSTGARLFTASCPDCGMHGTAVDAYPQLPAKACSLLADRVQETGADRLRYEVRRGQHDRYQAVPEAGRPEPVDGLGTVGRNVPDHHPESWQPGRPWDTTELPERQSVPERREPHDREQRLRDAADRVRRGVW